MCSPTLEDWNDQCAWSLSEMLALFKLVPGIFGVYNYLTLRIDVYKMGTIDPAEDAGKRE
jgi:hypothetical protein